MTEPTNPLFEEEKEFLERKKLEYERALRGDVEHIKEQTTRVGKVALVGAGLAGGIWFIAKAVRGRKRRHGADHDDSERYDDEFGADDRDRHLPDLEDDHSDGFGEWQRGQESRKSAARSAATFAENFGRDSFDDDDRNADDQNENDWVAEHDDPAAHYAQRAPRSSPDDGRPAGYGLRSDDEPADGEMDDDNGLSQYPDFPAHSAPRHGERDHTGRFYFRHHDQEDGRGGRPQPAGPRAEHAPAVYHTDGYHPDEEEDGPDYERDQNNAYRAWPYDDSRRLPESRNFADLEPAEELQSASPHARKRLLGPALMSFVQSDTGKALVAQAAAVVMAFVGKAVKDAMPGNSADGAETTKTSDLAASPAAGGNATAAAAPFATAASLAPAPSSDAPAADDFAARQPLA